LVQIGQGGGLSGTGEQLGGVSAAQLAEVQRRLAQQEANKAAAAAARAAAAGNGGGVGNGNGAPGPFDISSSIPNNFWGYVMLVVGMR